MSIFPDGRECGVVGCYTCALHILYGLPRHPSYIETSIVVYRSVYVADDTINTESHSTFRWSITDVFLCIILKEKIGHMSGKYDVISGSRKIETYCVFRKSDDRLEAGNPHAQKNFLRHTSVHFASRERLCFNFE